MLKGPHILLRAMEPADINLILEWENNPQNWLNSNTRKPYSRHDIENLVFNAKDIFTDHQVRFMIAELETGRTIGAIDLFDCDFLNGRAGLGILIENEADRGKGFGSEALKLTLDYCRKVLLLHQVFADVLSNNEKSLKLFERAGFGYAGRRKDWIKNSSGYYDLIMLQHIFNGKEKEEKG